MVGPRGWTVAIALALLVVSWPGTVAQDVEDTGATGLVGEQIAGPQGKLDGILAPTNAAPAFHLQGDGLRVELDEVPEMGLEQIELVPSFGEGSAFQVPVEIGDVEPSELWEGPYARQVVPVTATVPASANGLYDIEVPGKGTAHRALSVHEAWPETPRIVLLADPQTGDPRALSDGFEGSTGINPLGPHETHPEDLVLPPDPGPLNRALDQTLGLDVLSLELAPGDRWAAYRAAIAQVNELDPDLVLFSGDLTFGQLVPGSYHAEYEEAWRLLNGAPGIDCGPGDVPGVDCAKYQGLQVPTLLSPGNHDAYAANGEDGFAFWEAFFGPPAYATTFSNITLVSVNTYDWSELDRFGITYGVSAWGGQVRGEQLAWLTRTLCEANGNTVVQAGDVLACEGTGDERILTFSHHSPSWVQDEWTEQYNGACGQLPCQGTPGLEQVSRGVITFTTTGQGWSGEGRLDLRDLLRDQHVDLHAAGHTHRDRIARDIGNGSIVEVPQKARDALDITQLQLVHEENTAHALDQDEARALLRHGTGPLYVETTTTGSDTTLYMGYKPMAWHTGPGAFPEDALGIAPFEMGYPMTQALLDELAHVPERWNASHAELGLYSTPTFLAEGG